MCLWMMGPQNVHFIRTINSITCPLMPFVKIITKRDVDQHLPVVGYMVADRMS